VTTSAILSFVAGILVTLVGAMLAHLLERQRDRHRRLRSRQHSLYMALLEIHQLYFFASSAEMKKIALPQEIRARLHALAWKTADMLRESDDVTHLEETLDVLLGSGFRTATDRYDAMSSLIDRMGARVNPRYMARIRKISDENVKRMATGSVSNAPGSMWQQGPE
jgi:hypothetical protein